MSKRHADAIAIQCGVCNPSDVARLLVEAIDEVFAEGADPKTICADPAIRLIAHQLASLLNVAEVDNGLGVYRNLMVECHKLSGSNDVRGRRQSVS